MMKLLGSIEYTTPVKTMDVAVPLDSKKETFMNTIFHEDPEKQNGSNHVNGVESNEESGENRPSENGEGDENETKNIEESDSDTVTKETKKGESTEVSECKSSEENNQLNAAINKDEVADTKDEESTENGVNEVTENPKVEEDKPKTMDKKEIEIIDVDKKKDLNTEEEKESPEATKDSSGEANEDRSEEAKKDSIPEVPDDDDKEDVPDIIDDHNSPQESGKPEIKDDESQAKNSGISEEVMANLCEIVENPKNCSDSTVMDVDSGKVDIDANLSVSESDIVDTSKKDIDMESGKNDATSIETESEKVVTSKEAESGKDNVTSMEIESEKDVISMEAECRKDVTDKEKSADKEEEIISKRPMKTNEIFFEAVGTNSSDEEESEVELVDKSPLKTGKEQKEDPIEVTTIDEDEHRLENEALKKIQLIEDLSKSMEEFTNKSKRANQQPVGCEPQNKKQKIEETKYVAKQLKKIKRSTLETMLAGKVAEVMTNKSEIGKLRRQVDCFRESAEVWQKRADLYSKQIKDLSTVMRKYLVDSKSSKSKANEGPVRITRSVGLQVLPAGMRSSHSSLRGGRGGRTALLPRQGTTPPQNSVGAAAPPQPRAILHQQKPPVQQSSQQPSQPQVKNLNLPAKLSAQQQHQPLQLDAASQRQRQLSTSPKPGITRSVQNPSRPSPVVARPVVPIKPKPPAAPPSNQPEIVELDLSDDESTPAVSPAAPPPFQPVNSVKPVTTIARPQLPAFRLQGQAPPPRFQLLHRNRATPLLRHPAPLPNEHNVIRAGLKGVPPKPSLSITKSPEGVVLSWNMVLNVLHHETVSKYQLYAYQEQERQKPDKSLWKKVGNVKALPLPMACTLKQFSQGNKYHFAVRALDMFERHGLFSDAASIQI